MAAESAEFARGRRKPLWPMHDAIFENQVITWAKPLLFKPPPQN